MKVFTSIEQSKKLAEILPLESADMYWWYNGQKYYVETIDHNDFQKSDIFAWSLAALLEVFECPTLTQDKIGDGKTGWMVSAYPNGCRYDSNWYDNPIDACVEMIIKLHELKML